MLKASRYRGRQRLSGEIRVEIIVQPDRKACNGIEFKVSIEEGDNSTAKQKTVQRC